MSCTYEKVDLGSSSYQNGSEYTLRCRSLLPTISIISLSFGVHGIIYCAFSDSQVSIMLAGLAKPITVNIWNKITMTTAKLLLLLLLLLPLRRLVREADNLTTFMCRMSWKCGSLNLLEPSGPHWGCYGTPLPLLLLLLWPPPPPWEKWRALYHTYIDWKESRLYKSIKKLLIALDEYTLGWWYTILTVTEQ